MASEWTLGIDFGTTYTVAAVCHAGRTEVLEVDGQTHISSAVFVTEEGRVIVGAHAERRGAAAPDRLERAPKRYLDIGQPPIALGGQLMDVTALVAAVLAKVREEACRQHGSTPPARVVITHPAGWGARRRELLRHAAEQAQMPDALLVAEPLAAAMHLASERAGGAPVGDGEYVAVYDLGGGTFDTALLRRSGDGFDIVGEPKGDARIGGEGFDDRIYRHLGDAGLPPDVWSSLQGSDDDSWRRANWEFRSAVTRAKEAVSRDASSPIYIPEPVGSEVHLTRDDVEAIVREEIQETLETLAGTLEQGGVTPEKLAALYLVGGSSRMPVVGHLVRKRFGRADTKGDPQQAVALGAAKRGARDLARAPTAESSTTATGSNAHVRAPAAPAAKPSRRRAALLSGAVLAAAIAGLVLVLLPPNPHPVDVTPVAHRTTRTTPVPESSPTTPTQPTPTTTPAAPSTASRTSPASPNPAPQPDAHRRSQHESPAPEQQVMTLTGMVTHTDGSPYPGAYVEAQGNNLPNDNIHVTSGADGSYSMSLPEGFYDVVAGDLNNIDVNFTVKGGASNEIHLPPSSTMDFVASN